MLKKSNLAILALAILLALATTFAVMRQLQQAQAKPADTTTVSVVVAVKSVAAHSVVTSDDVAVKQVSPSELTNGAITKLDDAVGHYAATDWLPGQAVLKAMVTDNNQDSAFPLKVPDGTRAYTIANDAVTGVDHLISPGDHVDILVGYSGTGHKGPFKLSKVLLENVLVLYTDNAPPVTSTRVMVNGQSAGAGGSGNSGSGNSNNGSNKTVDTVTLAIKADDVARLEYARAFGQLHLVLRNPADQTTVQNSEAYNVFENEH